jgi:propanediol dehydratase large subunit
MEMTKAYDKDALVKALEKEGIEGGIEVLKKCVNIAGDWLITSADLSKDGLVGKLDDFAKPGVKYVVNVVNEQLDKLDEKLTPNAPVAEAPVAETPAVEAPPAVTPES